MISTFEFNSENWDVTLVYVESATGINVWFMLHIFLLHVTTVFLRKFNIYKNFCFRMNAYTLKSVDS